MEQRTGAVLQPGVVEHATDGTPPGDLVPRAAGPTSGRENELVDAGGVVVLPPTGTAGLSAAEAAAVSCLVFALLPERE